MKKILFVCLGNICRSPLAEGLIVKKIAKLNLNEHFKIDSCGTADYHIGELPDERTRENALKNDLELNHRARQFEYSDFNKFDHILVMDNSNKMKVIGQATSEEHLRKVQLMREFETEDDLKGIDVPDPYYGGEEGFQNVFDILDRCTENLLEYHLQTIEY
ncbi:low molecular weight protein-tyrosine-phosphatase [Marivirga arenosa]|jgi:protein-tyrosine phosphatase|uniref:protein-tyrosine-phosphatase n=1 Tax=Marivirga arenosa TaxID=3059076 RepID=A0AA49JHY4_9BACT|nr:MULTISPECIES: low molecular weight protein-tyrosine-phosphatase [unclassified Marivirga]WKK83794.1 low molecular weight protein-tyrosine-phosphatase [Marivirga sp. ABR2-2]WNB18797.1 low molecular weight protein-tyrosine-phosphatase [Marivirga sp. BKB1-2]